MKMLELENVSIMPDHISSLVTADNNTGITIHLKNGQSYWLQSSPLEVSKTHKRLVKEINEALW